MIQIQICILYFVAGWWKLSGDSWWSADAVYYALQNPQVARVIVPASAWMEPIFLAASLSVAWWEFLFPLLYAVRFTRKWALWGGVALHLGIFATMNIGFFPLVVLATYPAFLPASSLRPLAGRLTQPLTSRLMRRSQAQSPFDVEDGLHAAVEH